MSSVLLVLFVTAFITAVLSAIGKAPLWVSVLLLSIAGLLQVLPKG